MGPKAKTKAQRNIRSRAFTGCGTCRGRHLKCDEARPICGSCQRLGLPCEGYAPRLLWLADGPRSGAAANQRHRAQRTQAYRHPMFPETTRENLAAELSASTNGLTATDLIAKLDDLCQSHDGESQLPGDYHTGPFGVFESRPSDADDTVSLSTGPVAPPNSTAPAETAVSSTHISSPEALDNVVHGSLDPFGVADAEPLMTIHPDPPSHSSSIEEIEISRQQPSLIDAVDPGAGLTHPVAQHDLWQFDDPFSMISDLGISADLTGGELMPLEFFNIATSNVDSEAFAGVFDNVDPAPKLQTPIPKTHSDWEHLMLEAPALLRRYRTGDKVCEPSKQSFWRSFALPFAMPTFAEISVHGRASDAFSSVFYSTLANSAFAIQQSDSLPASNSRWHTIGKNAEEAGRYFLQCALRSEVNQTNCQELITATLGLALVSLYYEPEKTMVYLIETERLIRTRAVSTTQKPFQYRALSHVYTYFRIVMESLRFVIGSSSDELPSSSFGGFSVTEDALEAGLDPAAEKTSEVGYDDIHLDFNGRWQETLYTKIYGVPETLLTLLSQIVKLTNGRHRLETVATRSPRVADALRRHTKRLERNLWTMRLHGTAVDENIAPDSPFVSAVHQALILYFYRQVKEVDAMLLQDTVCKALNYLEPCLDKLDHGDDLAILFAWTALVVACEAATTSLQERALACLIRVETCAALFTMHKMSKIAQRVWERRRQTDDGTVSWLNVSKD